MLATWAAIVSHNPENLLEIPSHPDIVEFDVVICKNGKRMAWNVSGLDMMPLSRVALELYACCESCETVIMY